MVAFQDYSIRKKLMVMGMGATTGALVLACGAFITYDFLTYRATIVDAVSTLGEIISLNSAAAVVFNDKASATKTLGSLKARPGIINAAIYTATGERFAQWGREPNEPFTLPAWGISPIERHEFYAQTLVLSHPMILDKTLIGLVVIASDLNVLKERLKRYAGITFGVLALSLMVAAFISLQVGNRVSAPILDLVEVATTVSEKKSYSVRAKPGGRDELGLLVNTFNDMMAKIESDGLALLQARIELEERVLERTAQLTAANKELEAFSYSVSHDLRTPLRAIDGFSKELMENAMDRLGAQDQIDLKRIRLATQRMSQLIDDLLNLSRVTRNELVRESVNLGYVAEKVMEALRVTDPTRRVEFRAQAGLVVAGDLGLLRIALENLLGNAWKFTRLQSPAKIEFGTEMIDGKPTYFVRDNGVGFDMAYVSKLFGVFQRLHNEKEFPGTGIGLALVSRIIHRHGGRIWAESFQGRGATFYFTLL